MTIKKLGGSGFIEEVEEGEDGREDRSGICGKLLVPDRHAAPWLSLLKVQRHSSVPDPRPAG
jgi:hypothetical protein